MKQKYRQVLLVAGVLCFILALFQTIIGFFPSISFYFGAPEALVKNIYALITASIFIAGLLIVFGLYAFSGAGYIRTLPWLKPVLLIISCIFILRGFLLLPELLVVTGMLKTSIPVAFRFIVFSLGSLFVGLIFITGTIGGWDSFSATDEKSVNDTTQL
jgi:hypothetical protein